MKVTEHERANAIYQDFLREISGIKTYDELLKHCKYLMGLTEVWVCVNEFYADGKKEADGFDLDYSSMGFVIYKTENNGFRVCENASFYELNEDLDTETIDIEL